MPASKAANYTKWKYKFEAYWAIENDAICQKHLLDYFIDCGALHQASLSLTDDIIDIILQDDVINNPFKLGEFSTHQRKNLPALRECATAEMLLLCGHPKHDITKDLVNGSTRPQIEEQRHRTIQNII